MLIKKIILLFGLFNTVVCVGSYKNIKTENSALIELKTGQEDLSELVIDDYEQIKSFSKSEKFKQILEQIKLEIEDYNFLGIIDLINKFSDELDVEKIAFLINQAIDLNKNTLLHKTIEKDKLADFIFLIANGAKININNIDSKSVEDLISVKRDYKNAVNFVTKNFITKRKYFFMSDIRLVKDPKPSSFAVRSLLGSIVFIPTLIYLLYLIMNAS